MVPSKSGKIEFGLPSEAIESLLELHGAKGRAHERGIRHQQAMLAGSAAATSAVLRHPTTDRILGLFTTVFVHPSFYAECSGAADPWTMLRASQWASRGVDPFLSEAEIRKHNSGDGLFCMVANYSLFGSGSEARVALLNELLDAYLHTHRGFRLACLFAEPVQEAYIDGLLDSKFTVVNAYPAYRRPPGISRAPFLMAIDRAKALTSHNYFVCRLFDYRLPVAGFTAGSQELLLRARSGATDEELAEAMGLTVHAIKSRWAKVYESLESSFPGYLPEASVKVRGKERRRLAIAFGKENPWELRPYEANRLRPLTEIVSTLTAV